MTTTEGFGNPPPPAPSGAPQATNSAPSSLLIIRNRLLEGLLVLLPLLVTFWAIHWMYTGLEKYVIDPLAVVVIWKARNLQGAPELPYWFETFAAPVIALLVALIIVYFFGVIAHTRCRQAIDNFFLRLPLVSQIYDGTRSVLKCFDKPKTEVSAKAQRIVLVPFPHTGMQVPAIVTSTCQDVVTDKVLLCVYVPTTPVPASGFFLMIPEENATELNWDVQQTLQTIISGGLTAPAKVTYYKDPAAVKSETPGGVSLVG